MTEHDKKGFAAIMTGVAENFGQGITPQGIALRFEMLAGHEIGAVKAAAFSLLASRKYTTMPTVADFLEHLGGGSVEDKAEIEAGKVLQAISSVGGYDSVVFDDPVTQAVIQQAFGGWGRVCQESSLSTERWWRKEFAKAYAAYSRQGVTLYGYLPGQIEIGNTGSGYLREIPAPRHIGDREKAAAVLSGGNVPAVGGGERLGAIVSRLPYNQGVWMTEQAVEQ